MSAFEYSHPSEPISGRTPRPLAASALAFDLDAEIAALKAEPTWRATSHNARTLAKYADHRIVLVVLGAGSRVHTAQIDQSMTVAPRYGRVRVHLPDGSADVPAEHLLVLDSCVQHDIEALEESAFLLSIGWSKARPGAEACVP